MRIEGRLKLLGAGSRTRSGWAVSSVAEIGDREIRGLRYSPRLGSYLNPGEDVALGVQRILGCKTVFAVATADGRVRHEGIGALLHVLFLYAIAALACGYQLTHGGSHYFVVALIGLAWLATGPLKALRLCFSFAPLRT
ncbi:TPA: hypothetical protein QDB40_003534 [Burkholderia vietnamiensis]|uniref:hypothetical protein n=1 Tax=Burkholderia cepacia TaxID=292 RepID=UPI0026561209|nr:hypothetical protein [Burkholderia cepacia]MDN7857974.1 hypothetical protein [Burkholderia cepacia]HDR9169537.1 hypothetical protein [Burkholderia vietnamiensis]